MDRTERDRVPSRMQFLKCTRCRKDKKKCLPLVRAWPYQKCDRCQKYHYDCSPSMTSKQERDLAQPDQSQLLGPATEAVERLQPESLRRSELLPPFMPGYASFFRSLKNAYWGDFGVTPSESGPRNPNRIGQLDLSIRSAEASIIFSKLESRLGLVELARKYVGMVGDGILMGMTGEKAGIFACRKLIFELGMKNEVGGQSKLSSLSSADDIFQYFDPIISLALGWNKLLDTVGAPEVLLMNFSSGEASRTWSEEWNGYESNCPLLKLLSPEYGLKETCLRLSGVVDMIKRLNASGESELRAFLIGEIEKRVCDVLGDPDSHASAATCVEYEQYGDFEEDDDNNDDDDSMPDAEQIPINHGMGIFPW